MSLPSDSDQDKTLMAIPAPPRRKPTESGFDAEATVALEPLRSQPTNLPTDLAAPLPADGQNALLKAAHGLLLSGGRIRGMMAHANSADLLDQLLVQISEFDAKVRRLGVSGENVVRARYLLCTFLDESVVGTPWGATSTWAQNGLLVRLHHDSWGGEKCFQLLDQLLVDPARHIDLIELFYSCIVLGFLGQYRIIDGGSAALEQLKNRVYEIIRRQRGGDERDLATHWRGINAPSLPNNMLLSMWVTIGVGVALMLAVFIGLLFALNDNSDDIAWGALKIAPPKTPVTAVVVQEKPTLRLAGFLQKEIEEKLVEVRETERESVIIFRGDGLFELGSADPKSSYASIIARVADAMNGVPGAILVTGHTDSQKIRSARFPSNWHLSKARAQSVRDMLARTIKEQSRLTVEGRGDTEPVAGNVTPADRARNRRVEVTLFVAGV